MLTKKEYNEYLRKSFICIRKDDPPESYDFNGLTNAYKSFNIKSFYKYSSLESPYTIDNLNKNTFHFSLIQDLNDIFEFSMADAENLLQTYMMVTKKLVIERNYYHI